jgi:hypothetical protein
MAVTYGDITQVKTLLDQLTGKSLSDIEDIIEQCDSFFSCVLKIPSTFTYDDTKLKHRMLRSAVNTRAALTALTIASFNTMEEAALKLDTLYELYNDCKKFLLDPQNRGVWDGISEA